MGTNTTWWRKAIWTSRSSGYFERIPTKETCDDRRGTAYTVQRCIRLIWLRLRASFRNKRSQQLILLGRCYCVAHPVNCWIHSMSCVHSSNYLPDLINSEHLWCQLHKVQWSGEEDEEKTEILFIRKRNPTTTVEKLMFKLFKFKRTKEKCITCVIINNFWLFQILIPLRIHLMWQHHFILIETEMVQGNFSYTGTFIAHASVLMVGFTCYFLTLLSSVGSGQTRCHYKLVILWKLLKM